MMMKDGDSFFSWGLKRQKYFNIKFDYNPSTLSDSAQSENQNITHFFSPTQNLFKVSIHCVIR